MSTPRILLTGGLPDRVYEIHGDIYCWFKFKVSSSVLSCVGAGDSSLQSLLSSCSDSEIALFVYRVIANDDDAKRAKIILLRWTGCRATQKTRVDSALLQKLSSIFKTSLIVDVDDATTEDELNKRILGSCGAFKPSSLNWGSGLLQAHFTDYSPLLPRASSGLISERPTSPSKIRTPPDVLLVSVSELRIRTPPIDEDKDGAAMSVSSGAASPTIAESPLIVLTPEFS